MLNVIVTESNTILQTVLATSISKSLLRLQVSIGFCVVHGDIDKCGTHFRTSGSSFFSDIFHVTCASYGHIAFLYLPTIYSKEYSLRVRCKPVRFLTV